MPNESAEQPRRMVVLGNARSRRIQLLSEAARRVFGFSPTVIGYDDWQSGRVPKVLDLEDCLVRIESPGECEQTTRLILKAGIEPMESRCREPVSKSQIDRMEFGKGEVLHPLQWYLGYATILGQLEREWSNRGTRWMSSPSTIATAFDKLQCLELWEKARLPVPKRYHSLGTYAQIRAALPDRHARLFIKLRYGYSAMGAVALEWCGSRVRAITTVDVERTGDRCRLFVTKKPRVILIEREIEWLIDTLGREEILVEDWLPKARWQGIPFDLRIVTINRQPRFIVGRANNSPFTNLNLDAIRISRDDVASRLGEAWPELLSLSQKTSSVLPDACVLGIDVLVRSDCKNFVLLEANAFGDYLPGLTVNGMSVYEAQFRWLRDSERIPA